MSASPAAHPERSLSRTATLLCALTLGAGDIVVGAWASGYGPLAVNPGDGLVWLQYVSAALGSAWAWVVFAFVVGWFAPAPVEAAVRGLVGLVVAVVAYYGAKSVIGLSPGLDGSAILTWAQMSLVVGPVAGWLGHVARPPAWSRLPAALVVPAVMVADAVLRPVGPSRGAVPMVLLVTVLAVVVASAFVVRTARHDAPAHPA